MMKRKEKINSNRRFLSILIHQTVYSRNVGLRWCVGFNVKTNHWQHFNWILSLCIQYWRILNLTKQFYLLIFLESFRRYYSTNNLEENIGCKSTLALDSSGSFDWYCNFRLFFFLPFFLINNIEKHAYRNSQIHTCSNQKLISI